MNARLARGQAMAEYVTITTVLLFGALTLGVTWPFTARLFGAIQMYLDVMFYALNVAVG